MQACKYITDNLSIPTSSLGSETLMAAAKTAMSSKIVGADSDFFGKLVVDAVTSVRSQDEATGRVRYPVSAINILKAHGKSAKESRMLDGYALNLGRAAQVRPWGWGGLVGAAAVVNCALSVYNGWQMWYKQADSHQQCCILLPSLLP